MAKELKEWLNEEVADMRERSIEWISERYFFRDPVRPMYSNTKYFFSPADGIIIYQRIVEPDEAIIEIKGKEYTLKKAIRDDSFDKKCLVIGIFMTFYDVHINRIPYPGYLTYKSLDPIKSFNKPMLDVQDELIDNFEFASSSADYEYNNQRVVNEIFSPRLRDYYYILQVADYDVDCITPFNIDQDTWMHQNKRFSQIRYGSQVDLIVPIDSTDFTFDKVQEEKMHVRAGMDPLIKVTKED